MATLEVCARDAAVGARTTRHHAPASGRPVDSGDHDVQEQATPWLQSAPAQRGVSAPTDTQRDVAALARCGSRTIGWRIWSRTPSGRWTARCKCVWRSTTSPIGHWVFLRALWEGDGLTQRQLSREAGVMEPTTFAALKAMEARGYVVRRQLADNRRNVHVFLTPRGRALEAVLVPLALECNRDRGARRPAGGRGHDSAHAALDVANLAQEEIVAAQSDLRIASTRERGRQAIAPRSRPVNGVETPGEFAMSALRLTLAIWDYDRTRALADGSVRPDGIDLNVLNLHVEETFFRMLRNREFDVAEMSLSSYTVVASRANSPFIAIPVFPSRFFRQSCIFVSAKSGIREPKDLIGKRDRRSRIPDDGAGVDPRHPAGRLRCRSDQRRILDRRRGGARARRKGQARPAGDRSGSAASARRRRCRRCWRTARSMRCTRRAFRRRSARGRTTVRRLFDDHVDVERAYWQPHAASFRSCTPSSLRRDVYQANRWIAQSLLQGVRRRQGAASTRISTPRRR